MATKKSTGCPACALEQKRIDRGEHLGRRPKLTQAEVAGALKLDRVPSPYREGRKVRWTGARLAVAREARSRCGACCWHLQIALLVGKSAAVAMFSGDPKTPFMAYRPANAQAERLKARTSVACPTCDAGVGKRCVKTWHAARRALWPAAAFLRPRGGP